MWRGVIAIVALSVLLHASEHRQARRKVLVLGRVSEEADTSFGSFVRAMTIIDPLLARKLEFRFVDVGTRPGHDPASALRAGLAEHPAAVLATNGDFAMLAAQASRDVPIVFASFVHPVHAGFSTSMLHRAEPITGIWISEHLDGKRLEFLRDAYPSVRRVGVLMDSSWQRLVNQLAPVEVAAKDLGMNVKVFVADTAEEARAVFEDPAARDLDGWVVPRSYVAVLSTPFIVQRLRDWHKPLILGSTADVRQGGAPLSYATDTRFIWPELATLTARVLAGEHAGRIPIQRPQRYVLAVRTGTETGLPAPSIEVVYQADLVLR